MSDTKITFQNWLAKKMSEVGLAVKEDWITQDQAINLVNNMLLNLNSVATKNAEEAVCEPAAKGESRIILSN
ncbi:hypothetical protein UFOVP733_6 [uncultured Caudovirales phage]|uniref:Uncharacterized protein n=1 Tax=uncultured Caudovirales phage TaxID=2100421 RepID=A0A6J5NSQ0_9CAUD|nr:hypothetical protein UFOVP733_6 [uncultured Caudovirales phage]CAB5224970.1 hypothetical protein UFOVP743_53 [uncultured Caudovirales phage]